GGRLVRIYILLFLVMASWGFNVSALAVLVHHIDPITLTGVRIFTAGVVVLLIAKVMGIFRFLSKKEWKSIVLFMIFNVFFLHSFFSICLFYFSGVFLV